jgi:hypothetical protein
MEGSHLYNGEPIYIQEPNDSEEVEGDKVDSKAVVHRTVQKAVHRAVQNAVVHL